MFHTTYYIVFIPRVCVYLQDVALHLNLTGYQTFVFYGKLYGINEENVNKRIDELERLLKLPSLSMQIKNLR